MKETTQKADAAAEQLQFKHDEENVYDAIGVNQKKFEKKVDSYNKKMQEDGHEKTSERVELLNHMFTPVELAFLFASYQNSMAKKSRVRELLDELMGNDG